ncbi:MAG TPA: hypothetical protein VMA77_01300 [Solirubrobacteraceae bacterium]|nr:hypothetical protein [Solirubrobacteraceae bacterium]
MPDRVACEIDTATAGRRFARLLRRVLVAAAAVGVAAGVAAPASANYPRSATYT